MNTTPEPTNLPAAQPVHNTPQAAPLPTRAQETATAIAAKLAGTPTRYTPPTCDSHPSKCSHAETYHVPAGADLNDSLRFFGLTRRADGSTHLHAPTQRPRAVAPARTRENVAACAAVGLSFWSEAPVLNGIWAVDNAQCAHLVKIDRRANRVYVACMADHSLAAANHTCQYRAAGDQTYTVPTSNDDLAELMDSTGPITERAGTPAPPSAR